MSNSTEDIDQLVCENQKKISALYYGLKETLPEVFDSKEPWLKTLFLSYSNIVDMQFDGTESTTVSLEPLTGANAVIASDGQVYTKEEVLALFQRKMPSPSNPKVSFKAFSLGEENARLSIPILEWQKAVIAQLEAVFPLKLRIERTRKTLDALHREIKKLDPSYTIQTDMPDSLTEEDQLAWQKKTIAILRGKFQSFLEDLILKAKHIADLRTHICRLDESYYNSDIRNQSTLLYEHALSTLLSHKTPVEDLGHKKYSASEIKQYLTTASEDSFYKLFSNYGAQFITLHAKCNDLVIELLESTQIEFRQKEFEVNQKEIENLIKKFNHVPSGYNEFTPVGEISDADIQRQHDFLFDLNKYAHQIILENEARIDHYIADIKKLIPDYDTSAIGSKLNATLLGRPFLGKDDISNIDEKKKLLAWQEATLSTLEHGYRASLLEKARRNNIEIDKLILDIQQLDPNYIASDQIDMGIPVDINTSFIEMQEKRILSLITAIDNRKIEVNNKQISELQTEMASVESDYTPFNPPADLSSKELILEQEKYIADLKKECENGFEKEYYKQRRIISDLQSKIFKLQSNAHLEKEPFAYSWRPSILTISTINELKNYSLYLKSEYLNYLTAHITTLENRLIQLDITLPLESIAKEKEEEKILDAISEKENYIKTLNTQLSDFKDKHSEIFKEYYLWKAHIDRLKNEFEYFKTYNNETPYFSERCALYTSMIESQQAQYTLFKQQHLKIVTVLDEKGETPDPLMLEQIRKELEETIFLNALEYPYLPIRYYIEMLGMIDTVVTAIGKIIEKISTKIQGENEYTCLEQQCNGTSILIPERVQQQQTRRENLAKVNGILQEITPLYEKCNAHSKDEGTDDLFFEIQIRGDVHVGKSSLLIRIAHNVFSDYYYRTIKDSFLRSGYVSTEQGAVKPAYYEHKDQTICFQLLENIDKYYKLERDHDGRVKQVGNNYIHAKPHILLFCFDLSDRLSFNNVSQYLKEHTDCGNIPPTIILVGNKCDLIDARKVSVEEARAFAQEHGLAYFEISAKTGAHCRELLAYSLLNCLNPPRKILSHLLGNSSSLFAKNSPIKSGAVSMQSSSSASSSSSSSSSSGSSAHRLSDQPHIYSVSDTNDLISKLQGYASTKKSENDSCRFGASKNDILRVELVNTLIARLQRLEPQRKFTQQEVDLILLSDRLKTILLIEHRWFFDKWFFGRSYQESLIPEDSSARKTMGNGRQF